MRFCSCFLLLLLLSLIVVICCVPPTSQRRRVTRRQLRLPVPRPKQQHAPSSNSFDLNGVDLLVGRFDTSNVPSHLSFDWSGISFAYTFSGANSAPSISLDDNGNIYQVLLYVWAGDLPTLKDQTLLVTKARQTTGPITYPLFNDPSIVLDPNQRYSLLVSKRTEALFGTVKLYGFANTGVRHQSHKVHFQVHSNVARYILSPGSVSLTNNNKKNSNNIGPKSIEFLGDSLSCGYGNEGKSPCRFSALTENALRSFPIMTANALNATYSLTCWSGMGVVRNYNDRNTTSAVPFPAYYPRTLANDQSNLWNWQQFVPEAVVIALGTNDFSTAPRPSYAEFSTGYHRLLNTILDNYYPRKPEIFCVAFGSTAAYGSYTETIVKERNDKQIHYVKLADFRPEHMGCDGHPTVEGDWEAAQALTSAISDVFKSR